MSEILNSSNLRPTLLASDAAGAWLCYAEVEGFVDQVDDMRLKLLEGRESIERVTIIGNYATPMGDLATTGD